MKEKKTKIKHIEDVNYRVSVSNGRERVKFIKEVEKLVRKSMEYKDYIQFISKYMDMDHCAFFCHLGASQGNKSKIKIERHHAPLTLYDIVDIVLEKWISQERELNALLLANDVVKLHYQGKVGLIPLSKTMHKLVHNTDLIKLPLSLISDGYIDFLKEYEDYWMTDDMERIEDKLRRAIADSNSITEESFQNLVVHYEYLELEGEKLPQKLEVESDTSTESINKEQLQNLLVS